MLRRSMTLGTTAETRLSPAAAVDAVQPRFEAPARTNLLISSAPLAGLRQKLVIASIARTTLFVIGRRNGQASSPVRRYLAQLYAMMPSSARGSVSPAKVNG